MQAEALSVTLMVTDVLESLHVPYVIGGSMASASHGRIRTTLDVDIVAALTANDIAQLVHELHDEFYADAAMIRTAVINRSSFNLIHRATIFKVDIFVVGDRQFDRRQLERRRLQVIAPPDGKAFVASAEDVILAKLDWFRQGGEVSERQWDDIRGILDVQGDRLDVAYLRHWAADLNVADLLEQALAEDQTGR